MRLSSNNPSTATGLLLRARVRLSLFLIACVCMVVACSGDDDGVFDSSADPDAVSVQGVVQGWYCYVGDVYNNSPYGYPFSLMICEPSRVRFLAEDGAVRQVMTDDSSRFTLTLGAGTYTAIVESGFTRPDTFFNVELEQGDTLLQLDVALDVCDPVNLIFRLIYTDTLNLPTASAEWDMLLDINSELTEPGEPSPLDIDESSLEDADRRVYHYLSEEVVVTYKVPIRRFYHHREINHIFEVFDAIWDVIEADTVGRYGTIECWPAGGYACRG